MKTNVNWELFARHGFLAANARACKALRATGDATLIGCAETAEKFTLNTPLAEAAKHWFAAAGAAARATRDAAWDAAWAAGDAGDTGGAGDAWAAWAAGDAGGAGFPAQLLAAFVASGGDAERLAVPRIDAAILTACGTGALDMSDWHHGDPCGTTHCRAGWATVLNGEYALAVEAETDSPWLAGALVYAASRPGEELPDFYAATDDAMADIEKCSVEGAK